MTKRSNYAFDYIFAGVIVFLAIVLIFGFAAPEIERREQMELCQFEDDRIGRWASQLGRLDHYGEAQCYKIGGDIDFQYCQFEKKFCIVDTKSPGDAFQYCGPKKPENFNVYSPAR